MVAELRSVTRFIFGKILPKFPYPVLCGPLRGMRFVLGSAAGKGGGGSVYFNMVERGKTRAFSNILGAGSVVFDIGANVGYYTLLSSKLVGKEGMVLAFEPLVRNLFYLYRHVVLNRVENVLIIPMACSNRLDIANFSMGENCAAGHLEGNTMAGETRWGMNRMTFLSTVTVDHVVKHTGIAPDVLKIDVEGAEFEVLQGAYHTLMEKKPVILFAVHSSELLLACTDYLKGIGYVVKTVCGDDEGDMELLATRA